MGNLLEIRGHSYCRISKREILLNGEAADWVRTAASYETDARSCLPDRWPPPECSFASSGLCLCEPSAATAFFPGVRVASCGLNAAPLMAPDDAAPMARQFATSGLAVADERKAARRQTRSGFYAFINPLTSQPT